jgi:lipoprotein-releasing system permease protein
MNLKITRFLAWRYLQGTKEQRSLTAMVWVCALGIFIGTFALGLTTSIMNGFEVETHKKLQGILPDISIQAPQETSLESLQLQNYLQTTYGNSIAGTSDYGTHHIMLQKKDGVEDNKTVIALLKTINPEKESLITPLQEKVGSTALTTMLTGQQIIIGKEIAKELNIVIGDRIILFYNQTPEAHINNGELAQTTATVAGFLDTGIADYDAGLVIASHNFFTSLLSKPYINQIGIKLKPNLSEHTTKTFTTELKQLPDLQITTWNDQYPAIVSALKLEKYAMGFLLALITLVASMNSVSLLFMFITYKRIEIALLQSLGFGLRYIMLIFILFNLIISASASFFGLLCAYSAARLLQIYPCIELPDAYYVTHLPVHINLYSFCMIFIGTLVLSLLTALIPLASFKNISITNTLRFE